MEIRPTIPALNRVTLQTGSTADVQNWRVGQLLQATVQAKPENGLVSLLINNRIYNAQIQASVDIGQKLILEVVKLGTLPELRAVPGDPLQTILNDALRNSLPKQKPHADLLANIASLLTQVRNTPALPAAVVQVLKTLMQSFPDAQQMATQDGVRQAIRNSGIFLESALTPKPTTSPALALEADFKANLMRLQRALVQAGASQVLAEPQTAARAPLTTPRPGADGVNIPAATQTSPSADIVRPAVRESASALPVNPELTRSANPVATPTTNTSINPTINPTINPGGAGPAQAVNPNTTAVTPPNVLPNQVPVPSAATPANPQSPAPAGAGNPATPAAEGARSNVAQASPVERATTPTNVGTAVHQATTAMNTTAQMTANPVFMTQEKAENIWLPGAFIPFRLHQPHAQPRSSSSLFQQDSISKILAMLLKDTDSSIARVQMNQLLSKTVDQDTKQVWLFEIPVRKDLETDIFHFRIEKDNGQPASENENDASKWSIQLAFDLPGLGPVQSRISMARENVSVLFWAEVSDTVNFFQQHLQELQNNLTQAGLSVNKIHCMQGKAPEPDQDPDREQRKLLDEQV